MSFLGEGEAFISLKREFLILFIVNHRSHVWLEGSPAELGADVPRVYISIQLFNLSSLHLIQLAAPRGADHH